MKALLTVLVKIEEAQLKISSHTPSVCIKCKSKWLKNHVGTYQNQQSTYN